MGVTTRRAAAAEGKRRLDSTAVELRRARQICRKAFKNKCHFLSHTRNVHSTREADDENFERRDQDGNGEKPVNSEVLWTASTRRTEKRFDCDTGGWGMTTLTAMKFHKRAWTVERQLSGATSGASNSKSELNSLLAIHKRMTRFECHICGKKCYEMYNLRRLMDTHLDKQYPCHLCKKLCSVRQTVTLHIRTVHLKETKYPCGVGGHKFTCSSSSLAHERRTHSEGTPQQLQCVQCHKSLTTKDGLLVHIKACAQKKARFICPICLKTMARVRLEDHTRGVHLRSVRTNAKLVGKLSR